MSTKKKGAGQPSAGLSKRIRKPVESPRNAFDAAKLISKAMKNLYGEDRERALRWAIEAEYGAYPVRILKG